MDYEKKNMIPLGISGAPWPTILRKTQKDGASYVTTYELGAIEDDDNPLIVPSARSYAEVLGLLSRGLPTRNVLPAMEFVIARMDPNQNNRIANIVSDPGLGKSFLAVLLGKARDPRGPIITDAGGKNLEYLLFQTVFDTGKSRSLTEAIDKKLAAGTLDPLSVNALGQMGKHFSQKDGHSHMDWAGLAEDTKLDREAIRKTLELVRTVENLDGQSMGISFKVKEGPLVVAHREGRDLVIDELNKCKPGTETPLQIVWQVLNGEVAEHTVSLGNAGTFTFRRGQPGIVVCTGNLPKDGQATHLISESFDRRVPMFRLPSFAVEDWQDRICQMLTTMPVSIWHRLMPGEFKAAAANNPSGDQKWEIRDPQEFTKILFELSTLGMGEEEKRHMKNWQLSQINNWQNVLKAAEKLGSFYYNWSQYVDPESSLHKTGKFADILLEVDNAEEPTPKVTPSTMIRHIEQAMVVSPKKKTASSSSGFATKRNWNLSVLPKRQEQESVELNFGVRLVEAILDEVYRISAQVGKDNLYAQLMVDAEMAGLLGDDAGIAQLLNIDDSLVPGSPAQAKIMQGILADLLRLEFEDAELSKNDEDIVPLQLVQSALKQMADDGLRAQEVSPITNSFYVLNTDLDTVQQEMFKRVSVVGSQRDQTLDENLAAHPATSLVDHLTLLSSLAVPSVGEDNLSSLWSKAFTQGAFSPDEATAMAENQSTTGFAITSVLCCKRVNERPVEYVKLHVFKNSQEKHTIVVGDSAIPDDLYNRLKRVGVIYMEGSHPTTANRLASEMSSIDRAPLFDGKSVAQNLIAAFGKANKSVAVPSKREAAQYLASLLCDPSKSTTVLPNFVSLEEPLPPKEKSEARDNPLVSGLF